MKLFQRILEALVIRAVRRINAAENHRVHLPVAGQHLFGGVRVVGDCVAHARIVQVLDRRGDIADVARPQRVHRFVAGAAHADFHYVELRARVHHADGHARAHRAGDNAHKADGASVVVIEGVKDQRLQRGVLVARRRGHQLDHAFQHFVNAKTDFRADERRFGRIQTDHVLDFRAHLVRPRAGQVNLVDDRHDLKIVIERHIHVGQRLRLHALRRVHHQQRALACRQRAGYLVGKIHMAGGIDQVERIGFAVLRLVVHMHGLALDGNAALTLQLHRVEHLLHHLALFKHARLFQQPVRQRGFAVVDMGNDAEIANFVHAFQSRLSSVPVQIGEAVSHAPINIRLRPPNSNSPSQTLSYFNRMPPSAPDAMSRSPRNAATVPAARSIAAIARPIG